MNLSNKMLDVIMPCYNAEKYISRALESLRIQTFKEFRIIIIDDGSTDNTRDIVTRYMKEDERIELFYNKENKGVAYTRNKGLNLCTAKYIAYMDADDISDIKRFEVQIDYLESHPEIGAVSSNIYRIDSNDRIVERRKERDYCSEEVKAALIFNDIFANSAAMFRTQVVRDYSLCYNENDIIAEDYRFWCKFSMYSNMYIMGRALYCYRINDMGLTTVNSSTDSANKIINNIRLYMLRGQGYKLDNIQLTAYFKALNGEIVEKDKKTIAILKRVANDLRKQSSEREQWMLLLLPFFLFFS